MRGDARRIPALLRRGGRTPVVGGGEVSAWTPASLTPRAWYKYDDVTLSGANVTAWPDQSGNALDLTGPGGAQPTFAASGFNGGSAGYIRGSGTLQRLIRAGGIWSSTSITAYTLLLVYNQVTRTTNEIICHVSGPTASGFPRLRQAAASTAQLVDSAGAVLSNGANTPTITAIEITANGTSQSIYYGASLQDSDATVAAVVGSVNNFAIFANYDGVAAANCDLAEVVALERELTAGERASWVAYVGTEYGL